MLTLSKPNAIRLYFVPSFYRSIVSFLLFSSSPLLLFSSSPLHLFSFSPFLLFTSSPFHLFSFSPLLLFSSSRPSASLRVILPSSKLRSPRRPGKRNNISDITHTCYKLNHPFKTKTKPTMWGCAEFSCFKIPP